jgi:hypothetical protein
MVPTVRILAGAAAVCAALVAAGPAHAGELVTITQAGFSPNRLGMPTNAFGSATISSTTAPVPSPIRHVNVYGPAGVTLDLQGSGTCSEETLRMIGPQGCPANSRAGFGGGQGVYKLGKEIVEEKYTLDFFLSDNRPGHTKLAIFLSGSSPVIVEVVLTGTVIRGPKPYGLGFSVDVPEIKVLPEASNASAKTAFLTLGAHNVAYYRKVHGKRRLFHVRGIVLPHSCPRGGWPVASQFTFEDGSVVMAKRAVPCPRR